MGKGSKARVNNKYEEKNLPNKAEAEKKAPITLDKKILLLSLLIISLSLPLLAAYIMFAAFAPL